MFHCPIKHKTLVLIAWCSVMSAFAVAEDSLLIPVEDQSEATASSVSGSQSVAPATSSTSSAANARLLLLVERLQTEVAQLRGQNEDLSFRLKRLENTQKDRYVDIDGRIVALSKQIGEVKESSRATGSTLALGAVASAQVGMSGSAKPESNSPADTSSIRTKSADPLIQQEEYKAAFNLIRAKKYKSAIAALTDFVKNYPQSTFTANAYYWLGEVYLVEKKPKLAIGSFETVLNTFPDHRKIPDALYKSGRAYKAVGDDSKGQALLDQLLQAYPESSAAKLARKFLDQ